MAYGEDILILRKKIQEIGTLKNKDIYENTLIQIMNEVERNKQNCIIQAENLKKQSLLFEGQANAFASIEKIILNIIDGIAKETEDNVNEIKVK